MERLERKLKKASDLGASYSDIDDIGSQCEGVASKAPRDLRKKVFIGCTIDKLDELNADLASGVSGEKCKFSMGYVGRKAGVEETATSAQKDVEKALRKKK